MKQNKLKKSSHSKNTTRAKNSRATSHESNLSYQSYYGWMSFMLGLMSLGLIWQRFNNAASTNNNSLEVVEMPAHNSIHTSYPTQFPSLIPLALSGALAYQSDNLVLGLLSSWPLLFTTPVAAQMPVPQTVVPEFRVNSNTTPDQQFPAITTLPSGEWVVVWRSGPYRNYDIYAQRFASSGTPLGTEFRVNSNTTYDQESPAITSLPSGEWVVVWVGDQTGDRDIYAQRFASSGTPLGTEFRVNSNTTSFQYSPAIASLPSGEWVVVWMGSQRNINIDIYAQRFDNSGFPLGSEFRVNNGTSVVGLSRAVASLPTGEWVVVWHGGQPGTYDIYAQRFASSGTPIGTEFRMNNNTSNISGSPMITSLPSEEWVVVWQCRPEVVSDEVCAQRFDSSGTPLSSEFRVNNETMSHQQNPAITSLPSGEWVVAWESYQTVNFLDIYAQRFDSSGNPFGSEFRVNSGILGYQKSPAITSLPSGEWVVVWASDQTGNFDIYATIFSSNSSLPPSTTSPISSSTTALATTPVTTPVISTTISSTVTPTASAISSSAITQSTPSGMTSAFGMGTSVASTLTTSGSSSLAETASTPTSLSMGLSVTPSKLSDRMSSAPSTNLVPIIATVGGLGLAACLAAIGFYAYHKQSRANKVSSVAEKETGTSLRDTQGATLPSSNYARIDEVKKPESEYDAPRILAV